jgi:hypothetical protein
VDQRNIHIEGRHLLSFPSVLTGGHSRVPHTGMCFSLCKDADAVSTLANAAWAAPR